MNPMSSDPAWLETDPWQGLDALTAARIALGRCGVSLPTSETLKFSLAHARARDAVHVGMDCAPLLQALQAQGGMVIEVESQAGHRTQYLQRPDLGRRLAPACHARLAAAAGTGELVFVIGDGLSACAVEQHAVPLLSILRPMLLAEGWTLGPVVLARQARVALGDEIGALLQARFVVMLIGERPGLSSPDSMGIYLTHAPQPGRLDAERNCISNVRPAGLPLARAAEKLAWLLARARTLGLTGVALKDASGEGREAALASGASIACADAAGYQDQ